jgi:hypothetical protein
LAVYPQVAVQGDCVVAGWAVDLGLCLQPDEVDALHEAMRQLHLASASEALREGIRLLTREAAGVIAAEGIRRFYGAGQAPLPEGVVTRRKRSWLRPTPSGGSDGLAPLRGELWWCVVPVAGGHPGVVLTSST